MCGITGFLNARNDRTRDDLTAVIDAMASRIVHRGPDAAGAIVDETVGLAFGFRRLAILDLSPLGHQPMRSRTGRYAIVFNGEIYNYRELADELQTGAGRSLFHGHSDTEVILEAIEQWGFETALTRFHGMFAIALWDADTRTLALARDRMGEKPLYYGNLGDVFVFGSELKTIAAHPAFSGVIDPDSLAPLLAYGYIPAPRSIYDGIKKLPPGALLRVGWHEDRLHERPAAYWSLPAFREPAALGPAASDAECQAELDRILRVVIGQQMIADVPLGAFLSGGVDSSTVVAIMQSLSPRPIKTFTIGFEDEAYSEAHHARAVANHLGVDHTELTVTAADALATIPTLPHVYDEPFADPSQIPTLLVSKLAREQVTVSLSGDGADELFGGYDRYRRASRLWGRVERLPQPARLGLGKAFSRFPNANIAPLVKATKLAGFLERSADPDEFYGSFVTTHPAAHAALNRRLRLPAADAPASGSDSADVVRRFMRLDQHGYLPDDILVKVDRASMAFSLESRAPFLDDRVVEFAAGLPSSLLVRDGRGKWLLRELLYTYVPKELVDRPKMGFGVPIGDWLRGPLRGWAETLLDERTLRTQGLLDPAYVRRIWMDHVHGKANRQYQLWNILMLQAWFDAAHWTSNTMRPSRYAAAA